MKWIPGDPSGDDIVRYDDHLARAPEEQSAAVREMSDEEAEFWIERETARALYGDAVDRESGITEAKVAKYPGQVAITVVNSSHYDGAFDMNGAAERNDYALPVAYPFHFSDYVGYSHVKTKDDGIGAVDESDEFVTYVFRLKERIGRKWITP